MRIINKCPHILRLYDEEGNHIVDIPPQEPAIRVAVRRMRVGATDEGVPIYSFTLGGLENMPPKRDGVVYVVSGLVISACPEREDLMQPGRLLRNVVGEVVGAVGIERPARKEER